MPFRGVRLSLVLLFTLAGCEDTESGNTQLRSAGSETSEVGLIAPTLLSAIAQCHAVCDGIGCDDPCQSPRSEVAWLGGDKWLCSCECVDDPCAFLDSIDPATICVNPDILNDGCQDE